MVGHERGDFPVPVINAGQCNKSDNGTDSWRPVYRYVDVMGKVDSL